MDYQKCAAGIIKHIGGEKNVTHLEHCSTRLRFTLADSKKVNMEALKATPGVLGVVMSSQCQVIIGNEVIEVYNAVCKLGNFNAGASGQASGEKKKIGAVILDFIVAVFQPLVPAMAGAGVLKSVLLLVAMTGIIDKTGSTYTLLTSITDAVLYFLPLMVAVTAANKLGANRLVALGAVGVLILPKVTTLLAAEGGATLFGFGIRNIAYSSQVFPAILCVLFLSQVEKFFTRFSPKPIRIFFVPMMTFLVTVPVTLLVLGPLGYRAGELFSTVILAMYDSLGWVAIALLALLLPFMVSIGMHKAMLPYAITQVGKIGYDPLYLSASLAHNIAESGACFGIAIRSKDQNTRATAVSAGLSALFGITEPALYGLTIQNKRALYSVLSGCLAGGAFIGITAIKAFALVGPGLASMSMYVDENNGMNIIYAVIAFGISFIVAMIAAIVLWEDKKAFKKESTGAVALGAGEVLSPMKGELMALSKVKDEVFSAGILGTGVAIVPSSGEVYAPIDGTVHTVFDSRHAITLLSDKGAEILIHVGLETVKLEGRYFEPAVKAGDKVKAGELLMKFDLKAIKAAGYDITSPVILSNGNEFDAEMASAKAVDLGTAIMKLGVRA